MARRYARDNRGRFSGTGATARGGRLRTAAGNKRATQTTKLSGGKASGTIGKPKGLKPGAIKAKPQVSSAAAPKPAARKRAAASQQSLTQGRQARAAANFTRAAAAKPLPGNRRLTNPQVRSQLRTESAMKISKGGEAGAKEIRNARGLARTSKARNNQLQTRAQRLENAQRSGNPLITVSGSVKPATRKVDLSAKAAPKPAANPVPKSATSLQAVNARRARASAPRTSTYLSQKLNTQSAITRSAANAIYNRQRAVSKAGGLDKSVVRNPIGIMPKTSGSARNRAAQVREAARKRVVGGRRR